ncbi:hypothetical protein NQ315_003009 [Exocentrus adspersus]|uniref:Zinc finger CCHC domain-containing protein 7 n=1 Tax=Exocentrus adspersus TaxID=1586481 RepID=A0AAV8W4N5_9CUCU|nr:hypothetical protein NQ315_003009 [Exocentrus adspersus]
MDKMNKVCRLCLNSVAGDEFSALDAAVNEKLSLLVPDLKLIPTSNSVVCNTCKTTLEESYKLKRSCTSSNKLIRFLKNYSGARNSVDLKELIKISKRKVDEKWPSNEHVCRICLNSNEGSYMSIGDSKANEEYGAILISCLSTLDEGLTKDPLVCMVCTSVLQNMSRFIKQLTEAEKKVVSYSKEFSVTTVDLLKVLEFLKKEETSSLKSEDMNKPTDKETTSEDTGSKKSCAPADCTEEQQKTRKVANEGSDSNNMNRAGDSSNMVVETKDNASSAPKEKANAEKDELPDFNFSLRALFTPQDQKIGIKEWIRQVDEIKTKLNWSETKAKCTVLAKIKGIKDLHSWFSCAADVLGWEDWKEKFVSAFPDTDDYYINLLRMIRRRKEPNETYVKYFNEKMTLIKLLKISDEKAVSMLLSGVSNTLHHCLGRIGNYNTPDELLGYFMSCDDKNVTSDCFVSCSICNQVGHSVRTCRKKGKNLIVLLEKKKIETLTNVANKSLFIKEKESGPNTSIEKCSCCDRKGHLSTNCPLVNAHKTSNKTVPQAKSKPTAQKEQPKTSIKGNEGQKCFSCDKVGHSSADCPLTTNKSGTQQTQKSGKTAGAVTTDSGKSTNSERSQNLNEVETKCSFCDKPGHSSLVCPLIDCQTTPTRSNIKIVLDKDRLDKAKGPCKDIGTTASSDLVNIDVENRERSIQTRIETATSQKKCSCCDKMGHTGVDCPLLKSNVKSIIDASNKKADTQNKSRDYNCDKSNAKTTSVKDTVTQSKSDATTRNKPNATIASHLEVTETQILHGIALESEQMQITLVTNPLRVIQMYGIGPKSGQIQITHIIGLVLVIEMLFLHEIVPEIVQITGRIQVTETQALHGIVPGILKVRFIGGLQIIKTQILDGVGQESVQIRVTLLISRIQMYGIGPAIVQVQITQLKIRLQANAQRVICNKYGHLSVNCSLNINKAVTEDNSTSAKPSGYQDYRAEDDVSEDKDMTTTKCLCCNNFGHFTLNCPLIQTEKPATQVQLSTGNQVERTVQVPQSTENRPGNVNDYQRERDDMLSPSKGQCMCCSKYGHSSLNCPLLDINNTIYDSVRIKQRTEQIAKNLAKKDDRAQDVHKNEHCTFCNKSGHLQQNCPFYSFFNKTVAESKEKPSTSARQEEERFESRYTTESVERPSQPMEDNSYKPPEKKAREDPNSMWRTTSVLNDNLYEPPEKRAREDPNSLRRPGALVCEFCKRVGHRLSDCFFAKFDRNIYDSQYSGSTSVARQCLYCGKFGHLQPDCPKFKPPDRRMNTRR